MKTKTSLLSFVSNDLPHIIPTTPEDLNFTGPHVIYDVDNEDRAWAFDSNHHDTSLRWDEETQQFGRPINRKVFINHGPAGERDQLVITPNLGYSRQSSVPEETIPLENVRIAPALREYLVDEPHDERNQAIMNHARITIHDHLDTLTHELHQIGNDADWCSAFDELLASIGLETRTVNYVSDVSARFSMDIDSPSSQLDEAITYEISDGSSIAVDTISIVASIDVSVYWTGRRDDEPDFDDDEVESAVRERLGLGVDVIEWDINSTEEEG